MCQRDEGINFMCKVERELAGSGILECLVPIPLLLGTLGMAGDEGKARKDFHFVSWRDTNPWHIHEGMILF